MTDFRCFSLHFYFKILDSETFGGKGSIGYSMLSFDESIGSDKTTIDEMVSIEGFKEVSEEYRKVVSSSLDVPLENVIQISRDEYKENTEDEEL